ncbi:MAG: T9SS type A sorting domain-containing protein [Flavobacteriia bacterium]|nr:T9SS type A sorting domain-containing protein [Flavobacteriia bacterium]
MKTLAYVFILYFTCWLNIGNSQVTEIYICDSTSSQCVINKVARISLHVGNLEEVNPLIQIDWGDGTTSEINNLTLPSNYATYCNFIHNYEFEGTYSVIATVVSNVNSQTLNSDAVPFINSDGNCGRLNSYAYQVSTCDNTFNPFYHFNGVFDLTDINGITQTYLQNLSGVNINNSPYTLSLNENWLLQNNLIQTSEDLIISNFDQNGYSEPENTVLTVATLSLNTEPDFSNHMAFGYAYANEEFAQIYFSFLNHSCSNYNDVRVKLTFDSILTPSLFGLLNPILNNNELSFDVLSLTNDWIGVNFFMPGSTEFGRILYFNCTLEDINGVEIITTNNSVDFQVIVINSFDPNNKLVNKAENINPTEQEELIYTINFQNEGNADALKVVIKDTLSDNLDLSTFEVIRTKHNVVTSVNPITREVKFTFNDIYLAPKDLNEEGSKGYVVYKIKEKVNLPINSEIKNTAYIYFDFNPVIVTNTTLNRNTLLSVNELSSNEMFSLYPNPVSNLLQINSKEKVKMMTIYSADGVKLAESNANHVDVSKLVNGVYFVEVLSESSNKKEKIVIQH